MVVTPHTEALMVKLKLITEYTIDNILTVGSKLLIGALVALVSYSAIARYVFSRGLGLMEELAGLMLIGIAFLAFAHVLNIGQHVRVTLVTSRLPKVARNWMEIIAGLVGLAYSIIITKLTCDFAYTSYLLDAHSPASYIYMVPWMALMPIGMLALAIAMLMFCVDKVRSVLPKR